MIRARKFRVVFRNVSDITADDVREAAEKDLGKIKLISWKLEKSIYYSGPIEGFPLTSLFRHRIDVVLLSYYSLKEWKEERKKRSAQAIGV